MLLALRLPLLVRCTKVAGTGLGLGIGLGAVGGPSLTAQIAAIFATKQGAWLDESIAASLYQDSAGTTPVTAVEQPIGLMLDQSGSGNHASQSTVPARPLWSSRVNLLTKTEDFSAAAWSRIGGIAVTSNTDTAPDGTLSMDTLTGVAGVTTYVTQVASVPAATNIEASIYIKAGTSLLTQLRVFDGGVTTSLSSISITWSGGVPSLGSSLGSWVVAPTLDTTAVAGVYRLRGTVSSGAFTSLALLYYPASSNTNQTSVAWGAQLALGASRYQRVNTATDYDTTGFPLYAKLDGIDDNLVSTTGGGGTAGVFLCQVIKPTGGAGTVRRLWSDRVAASFTGYSVQINASNQLEISAGNGTAYTSIATVGTLAIGTTALITAWNDGANLNVQIDGGAVASVARPVVIAGTAGFTIGKDNGAASGYFTGNLYPEIYIKGDGLTSTQRSTIQAYCKQKSGL